MLIVDVLDRLYLSEKLRKPPLAHQNDYVLCVLIVNFLKFEVFPIPDPDIPV